MRCKNEVIEEQLYFVEKVVKAVGINMKKEDAVCRVRSLRKEYANPLKQAEYVNIVDEKPHIAINYLLRELKPV